VQARGRTCLSCRVLLVSCLLQRRRIGAARLDARASGASARARGAAPGTAALSLRTRAAVGRRHSRCRPGPGVELRVHHGGRRRRELRPGMPLARRCNAAHVRRCKLCTEECLMTALT